MTTAVVPSLSKFDAAGEPAGTVVAPAVFAVHPHAHAVYLAVVAQLSNARVGTASTKTKGEVSGGGRKPWRQKHTGRARQGSTRAPQWPGGGISFGPRPRKYPKDLPRGIRRLALRSVLAAKMKDGRVVVVNRPVLDPPKTKTIASLLAKLGTEGAVVFVGDGRDEGLLRACRNLPRVRVAMAADVSVYDLLNASRIMVTAEALASLAKRCGPEDVHAS
ncbi:MAG: 50S ribosomal protein L4 [Candidatus Coatesbacteria bacterium]